MTDELERQGARKSNLRAAGVALVSVVLAAGLGNAQQRPLGDDPIPMIVAGSALAALAGALRCGSPSLVGLAAMAGLPICAAVDLVLHGGHNLLPFEFAFYGLYGLLGIIVARIGGAVGRLVLPSA